MAQERAIDALRARLEARDRGQSELRDEFSQARTDDPSQSHENAHLRGENQIDRTQPERQPANQDRGDKFSPKLAEKGHLERPFDRARTDNSSQSHEQSLEAHTADTDRDDKSGSNMVREDQPRPESKPPKEIREQVDRKEFAKRWADERAASPGRDIDRSSDFEQGRDEREMTHDR